MDTIRWRISWSSAITPEPTMVPDSSVFSYTPEELVAIATIRHGVRPIVNYPPQVPGRPISVTVLHGGINML